jgi:hypothetical protein
MGMTKQTDKKHLCKTIGYLVGGVDEAFNCLGD